MQNDMSANNVSIEFPKCHCATAQDHELGIAPCCSSDHWSYALAQIRKNVYNSTTAFVSSPAYYINAYENKYKKISNKLAELPLPGSESDLLGLFAYNFNAEPLSTQDIFEYRQLRSEHLLMRMLHCFDKHDFNISFVRLSLGTFMIQKWEFGMPLTYLSANSLTNAMDLFIKDDSLAPIDTFTFNDLFNDMMEQTNITAIEKKRQEEEEEKQRAKTFIPYTHTLGIRYTNPYNYMRDILVRGNIPLWCQTLFITECLRLLPIAPGTVVHGILPFAKDIGFHFQTVPIVKNNKFKEPYPEIAVMYERFAMELSDPQMMLENRDVYGKTWEDVQNKILAGVLYCEIPDHTATMITSLSIEWAKTQGLS
ncbi:hypothetical protein INT46_007652 [Mucor plumbeus]|uniref:Uncharacterized protein n=1 Tax=Mucor plumbeus TaxID=97098 RepID=A0A8H7UPJ5_9FUNG|nr:hypothetical protein INT46_007652 [Mucor plumbeus]